MSFSRKGWSKYFGILGRNLLRDSWYPTVGAVAAQALISPESTWTDCLTTGLGFLIFVVATAMFCFGFSWAGSLWEEDE